jgi:Putative polyhydroxyalkanoic acid system protein (PHA_gran_rgn)
MSNSIVVNVPHNLGAEEAKRRIVEELEHLRRDYIDKVAYSEASWNGDTADLRVVAFGQTATGKISVMSDSLRLEVQLPWILAALTGKIRGVLKSNAEESHRALPTKGLNKRATGKRSARIARGALITVIITARGPSCKHTSRAGSRQGVAEAAK